MSSFKEYLVVLTSILLAAKQCCSSPRNRGAQPVRIVDKTALFGGLKHTILHEKYWSCIL